MERFVKRTICFLLALIMAFGSSASVLAMELEKAIGEESEEYIAEEFFEEAEILATAEDGSLEDIIREQVETFAKSIDMKNAGGEAKDAIVAQGLFGGGKKLSVGKGHALTATLFNSGLLKTCITDSIDKIIKTIERVNEKNLYGHMSSNWKINGKHQYSGFVYDYVTDKYQPDYILRIAPVDYSGKTNSYDSTLELIAGNTEVDCSVETTKITKNEKTYKITCKVSDRFDFDTSAGLISGLAAFLFKEFDWESKVSFNVTVPYYCSHVSGNYGWTYDTENHIMNSISEGFEINEAEKMVIVNDNGTKAYYHELDKTVNLLHDKPWVLEYTVTNPGYFALAPVMKEQYSYPFLCNMGTNYLFFQNYEEMNDKKINNCYGIPFNGVIPKQTLYTVTLENTIDGNGRNMIYLSVLNDTNQKYFLKYVPMNKQYIMENGVLTLKSSESDKLSGMDFLINYIGNKQYAFSADYFDLRIWENGKDSESASCFEAGKTTAPSCTEKGYTTYTCSLCGYSKKDSYKEALGHSLGEWEVVTKATAENPGEEQRKCKNCEHSESRVIPALGYTLSDVNLDGSVDVMDAYFIRLVVAKLVEPTAKQIEIGDVDLDGKITAIDANIIRKYAVGIIKKLPVEQ